jgi:hypothetical protein
MSDAFGIEPLLVVISKEEVDSQKVASPLGALKTLLQSPERARYFQEKVDIAFHGYDEDSRELFEIPEVRNFVYRLDEEFPYWLFFLSKHHLGLQCLLLCFLPPYLTDEAKARIFPERVRNLLLNRWIPAMNQICEYVSMSGDEIDQLTERAVNYVVNGRTPLSS